eukprot:jgi/Ulvmu1/10658/UM066_0039.1
MLAAQHSMHSTADEAPQKARAQALADIHTTRSGTPQDIVMHARGHLHHGSEMCAEQFNTYLDVHDCQVVSCSPTASPGSHCAPSDSPRAASPHACAPLRSPPARKLVYDAGPCAADTRQLCMLGPLNGALPARGAPLLCRPSLDFDPVATVASTATAAAQSVLASPRDSGAASQPQPRPSLEGPGPCIPGRVSLSARSAAGHSAFGDSSMHHARPPQERALSPRHSGPRPAATLISAHCRTVSGSRPVHLRLQPSPFSMSSFCGSAESANATAHLNMHANSEPPESSGSETSEDLDNGTLPQSECSDPFLDQSTGGPGPSRPETPALVLPPPIVPAQHAEPSERVLSYDPNDSCAHVFRTFLHVPGPPERPCTDPLATLHLTRCFCGGGESLYGSACMCGGASSFARAAAQATSTRTETVARRSEAGTCVVYNGPSLIDDTSDSNVMDTRTVTEESAWVCDAQATSSGRHGRMRSSPSPSDSADVSSCACGDIADSGLFVDAEPMQTRIVSAREWQRPAAPPRCEPRHLAHDHAARCGHWTVIRTGSDASATPATMTALSGSEPSTMVGGEESARQGLWRRSAERTSLCSRRERHCALHGALQRVHAGPAGTLRDLRDVEVQVHAPPSLLRRTLLNRVLVPRLQLPFRQARSGTARSASEQPRGRRGGAS